MNAIRILLVSVTLAATTAAEATAQTVSVYDTAAPRAGLRVGYGGHGIDLDASVDSPLLLGFVRFRGAIGLGDWAGFDSAYPPAGANPLVTRVAGSLFISAPFAADRRGPAPDNIRWYIGAGIVAFVPRVDGMNAQRGTRVFFGIDFSGERWTFGPEIEIDFPRSNDVSRPFFTDDLLPTARVGVALRRHF